jgi:hypothetical protein
MKQQVDEFAIMQNQWWGQYFDASVLQQQSEVSLELCAARRATALARLHADGYSLAQIAGAAGLTPRRVCQLIARDRRGPTVPSRRKIFCVGCGGALPGECRCGDDDGDE